MIPADLWVCAQQFLTKGSSQLLFVSTSIVFYWIQIKRHTSSGPFFFFPGGAFGIIFGKFLSCFSGLELKFCFFFFFTYCTVCSNSSLLETTLKLKKQWLWQDIYTLTHAQSHSWNQMCWSDLTSWLLLHFYCGDGICNVVKLTDQFLITYQLKHDILHMLEMTVRLFYFWENDYSANNMLQQFVQIMVLPFSCKLFWETLFALFQNDRWLDKPANMTEKNFNTVVNNNNQHHHILSYFLHC